MNENLEYIQLSIKDKIVDGQGGVVNAPSRTATIKPVVRESAQGRHLNRDKRTGKPLNQNRARTAAYHFSINVSTSRGLLNTGFWELIENPYKTKTAEESNLASIWVEKGIWSKSRISIQEYLEIKYGLEPGFLTSAKPNIKQRKGAKQTYLQAFTYPLGNQATVLDLDKLNDEIMYLASLRAKKIANSAREANPLIHSHYISKVNEGEIERAKKTEKYEAAVAKLYDLKNNYDGETVKKFAVVLDLIKDVDMAVNAVKNRLTDFVNDKKYKYENIAEFNSVYELLTGNKNDKYRFETIYLLRTLVAQRIFTVYKGKHQWGNAPEQSLQTVALSEDSAITWLMDPDSKDWRKMLTDELKSKTGISLK